jgi:hypothetical protein
MWTIQEAVLPPKAVVMYDTWSMLFEDFLGHCYKDLETQQMGCCKEASQLIPVNVTNTIWTFHQVCKDLKCDLKELRQGRKKVRLNSCFGAYGHRECSDPRDKVYGMLALIYIGRIAPDYSASLASAFYWATRDLLNDEPRALQSLIGVQFGPSIHKLLRRVHGW